MLKQRVILRQLKRLESLYASAAAKGDIEHQNYYSKLALLECAGWVEESMDVIARRCLTKRHIRNRGVIDFVDNLIDKNYGFDYERNFKKLICQIIGVAEFYKIEKNIDALKLSSFVGALNTLTTIRNAHAHTYILNTTKPFYAPSWTINIFKELYEGLTEFYRKIKKLV